MTKDKNNNRWHSDYNILFNRVAPKLCMAGYDCKPAAKCHSISVGRVLNRIAEDGQVIAIVPSEMPGRSTMKPQGISRVSTFSGFCSKHDQELFAPIDNFDYTPENLKQEFLFSYRTVARYYYYKLAWRYGQEAQLGAYENARTTNDVVLSPQKDGELTHQDIDGLVQFLGKETADAVSESNTLGDLMGVLNSSISRKDYSLVSTRVLHFSDEYPVAQSGSMIIGGNGHERWPHMITINVIPQEGQTYALLSCMSGHGTICIDRHLESFRFGEELDYHAALTHIICMNGDPLAINPSYWESLPSELRSSFIERLNLWQHGGIDPVQSDGSFNILQKIIPPKKSRI